MSRPLQVGVVGLGLMGHGIAQVTADKGFQVVAVDASQEAVDRVRVGQVHCLARKYSRIWGLSN